MVTGSAVKKYGPELEKHQQLLLAAADILIEIYMAESTVLRTEKNVKRFGEDKQAIQIAMAQVYVYEAIDIISQKAKEAILVFAEGDEQKMLLMGLKRFTKYQEYPNVAKLREQIADNVAAENGYYFDTI